MNKKSIIGATLALSMAVLAHASWAAGVVTLEAKAAANIKRDFRDKGIAKADRVIQDKLQASCSKYLDNLPKKLNEEIKAEQEANVKYPADGIYMGDWKAGEKLAQSGRGMTWSDKAEEQPGGNCYNCHRLSSKEIAYGTIGPSLLHIGKERGNTPEMQKYIYGRIYNAKAYNPCANMPRFGHMGILGEKEIKDLVALLLDPESPVNK